MYFLHDVMTGSVRRPPEDLPQTIIKSNHLQWVSAQLFYVGLWCVKLSFLTLFARLGQKVRGQKVLWWIVLVVTLSSLVIVIAISGWQCLLTSSTEKLQSKFYLSHLINDSRAN